MLAVFKMTHNLSIWITLWYYIYICVYIYFFGHTEIMWWLRKWEQPSIKSWSAIVNFNSFHTKSVNCTLCLKWRHGSFMYDAETFVQCTLASIIFYIEIGDNCFLWLKKKTLNIIVLRIRESTWGEVSTSC